MNNPKDSQKTYLYHPDFGDIKVIADAQDFLWSHLLLGLQNFHIGHTAQLRFYIRSRCNLSTLVVKIKRFQLSTLVTSHTLFHTSQMCGV